MALHHHLASNFILDFTLATAVFEMRKSFKIHKGYVFNVLEQRVNIS